MEILNKRRENLYNLITAAYDETYTQQYERFSLQDSEAIREAAQTVLREIPQAFGLCVVMSAHLGAILTDEYKLPAVVVAGNLVVSKISAFKTDVIIQRPGASEILIDDWEGHCWVEVGGVIIDISICRTADLAPNGSNLKSFVHKQFGKGKGLLAFPVEYAYSLDMIYEPREVLSDSYITAIIQGYNQ